MKRSIHPRRKNSAAFISCLSCILGGLIAEAAAHAGSDCDSVTDCEKLSNAVHARLNELQPAVQLGPIVRT